MQQILFSGDLISRGEVEQITRQLAQSRLLESPQGWRPEEYSQQDLNGHLKDMKIAVEELQEKSAECAQLSQQRYTQDKTSLSRAELQYVNQVSQSDDMGMLAIVNQVRQLLASIMQELAYNQNVLKQYEAVHQSY